MSFLSEEPSGGVSFKTTYNEASRTPAKPPKSEQVRSIINHNRGTFVRFFGNVLQGETEAEVKDMLTTLLSSHPQDLLKVLSEPSSYAKAGALIEMWCHDDTFKKSAAQLLVAFKAAMLHDDDPHVTTVAEML